MVGLNRWGGRITLEWVAGLARNTQETGFDSVTPHQPIDISSWALDRAKQAEVPIKDNCAYQVNCYHPGYTLVEKLQAISTKYRKQQESGQLPTNFIRHYYDVYCLLQDAQVQHFIGTEAYHTHKANRFPNADNQNISENEAFILSDPNIKDLYQQEYARTATLYYQGQPSFDHILTMIEQYKSKL